MKLTIRKMMDQDLEPLCVLLSDPDVMRFLEPPYSNEQSNFNQLGNEPPPKAV